MFFLNILIKQFLNPKYKYYKFKTKMLSFVINRKNYRVMKSTLQIQMKSAENN